MLDMIVLFVYCSTDLCDLRDLLDIGIDGRRHFSWNLSMAWLLRLEIYSRLDRRLS